MCRFSYWHWGEENGFTCWKRRLLQRRGYGFSYFTCWGNSSPYLAAACLDFSSRSRSIYLFPAFRSTFNSPFLMRTALFLSVQMNWFLLLNHNPQRRHQKKKKKKNPHWQNLFVHPAALVTFPCVGFIHGICGADANHSDNVASQADVGYEK